MDLLNLIKKRRAYRSLAPVEVTQNIIHELSQSARLAPSCFNNQPWRFVFVYKKKKLEEVFGALSRGNEWAKKASLVIAVMSKKDLDCRIKGREYYLFDTGMAAAFIILRATDLGLIAHPIAGFDESRVKTILDIPDEMTVITLLIVGKHSETISSDLSETQLEAEKVRPQRLPFESFVFRNAFGNIE